MAVVTFFGGSFCHADEIAKRVAEQLDYRLLNESQLIEEVSRRYSSPVDKIKRAMYGTPSLLDNITHEKEKNIAYIKAVIGQLIREDNIVYSGFAGILLPKDISHILKVYLIANREYRIDMAVRSGEYDAKQAGQIVRKNDNESVRWIHYLTGKAPWDESLYDIIFPMHSTSISDAVRIICENTDKDAVKTTPESQKKLEDFILASQINVELVEKGHNVTVQNIDGEITLLVNKYVMRFEHYKHELIDLVNAFPSVSSVDARFGPNVNLPTAFPELDLKVPSKILLVDDEVEFVHTLSERLKTRSIESSVVYDGEEALSVVEEEEPEVMILDLKMPGINGIEVLRKVKSAHPDVEVIILTGHGSEKEKALADELGAFAYLEKPVDIEVLTKTMQEANKKVAERKEARENKKT